MSYLVTLRTQEMGIRLALGARPGQVLQLIVREGHKGVLKVFSIPGQGTTFKVLLPAGAAVRKDAAAAVAHSALPGQGMVLVIDVERIVRKMAANSLERYGYTVVTAEDGREGLERFRELHPRLKLVLLDMTMPVMSGEEALQKMRLINPRIPVVMSSGHNEAEAIGRFAGKGIAGFLQKPYRAAALGEKVRRILREAEELSTKLH